ncbi:hypothetical protein LIER_40750 [Lithospermum erythrorhizon]|uniref:Uncharacterized protein n=1 Tax=Lithospermum erythrorhizon TaxID=34254 RepID=A0AAV3R0D4_LITER
MHELTQEFDDNKPRMPKLSPSLKSQESTSVMGSEKSQPQIKLFDASDMTQFPHLVVNIGTNKAAGSSSTSQNSRKLEEKPPKMHELTPSFDALEFSPLLVNAGTNKAAGSNSTSQNSRKLEEKSLKMHETPSLFDASEFLPFTCQRRDQQRYWL